MCVAAMAWMAHPRWRLVVAANRDELHDRLAAPLARWPKDNGNGIIAGRDLRSGGTWLGVQPQGRCVLVTNYRVPGFPQADRPSRGALVTALLNGADPATISTSDYNPFNLFSAGSQAARIISNYPADLRRPVPHGILGLSNGSYDEPWPKTIALSGALGDWLAGPAHDLALLFTALAAETQLSGSESDTGPEAQFSAVFIRNPQYGTRCSTVLAIDHAGRGTMIERRFDAAAQCVGQTELTIGGA